jgi:hypothetical protein
MAGTSFPHEESLSHDDAIQILNEWGSRGFFRNKKFGTSIHLQSIQTQQVFPIWAKDEGINRRIRILQSLWGNKFLSIVG